MKTLLLTGLLTAPFVFTTVGPDIPQKPEDISPLLVGETIPDVKLLNVSGQTVDLKAEVAEAHAPTVTVGAAIEHACIVVTILLFNEIAPAVERPRPSSDAPVNKLIAPLASTVPLKSELMPKSTAPFT